jgi:hypothetical protein
VKPYEFTRQTRLTYNEYNIQYWEQIGIKPDPHDPWIWGWVPKPSFGGEAVATLPYAKLTVSSVTTKPWPKGRPTVWTNHQWRTDHVETREGYKTIRTSIPANRKLYQTWTGHPEFIFQHGIPVINFTDDLFARVDYATLENSLLGQLKDQKFNAAEALGEVRSTAEMIVKRMNTLANAALALKKGNLALAYQRLKVSGSRATNRILEKGSSFTRSYRQRSRDASSRAKWEKERASEWLELQYGWIPLVKDIHDGVEMLQKGLRDEDTIVRAKTWKTAKSNKKLSSTALGFANEKVTLQKSLDWTERRTILVDYKVDDALKKHITSLGLTNPLSLAWELAPWSLVVDWVYPIGTMLSNLDATYGCVFVRGSHSLVQVNIQEEVYTSVLSGQLYNGDGYASRKTKIVVYQRNLLNSFPTVSAPRVKNPFSTKHAANALAFLSQAFLGKR